MTDYSELVKALRCCKIHIPCKECPKYKSTGSLCVSVLHDDAAAAIEELQQIADHYEQTTKDYWKEACEYKAQFPKRGEWIIHGEPPMLVIECSVCGQKYFNHVMQEKAKYCSMCGAKMGGTK